ncbi:hypothetical protein [Streptomyces sp. NPDC051636]|uniref:hypothetical protein n=1 Tax=Streptomyces sp. NPDC051636 TaxID=3365663 RepID=UPI0037AD9CD8
MDKASEDRTEQLPAVALSEPLRRWCEASVGATARKYRPSRLFTPLVAVCAVLLLVSGLAGWRPS